MSFSSFQESSFVRSNVLDHCRYQDLSFQENIFIELYNFVKNSILEVSCIYDEIVEIENQDVAKTDNARMFLKIYKDYVSEYKNTLAPILLRYNFSCSRIKKMIGNKEMLKMLSNDINTLFIGLISLLNKMISKKIFLTIQSAMFFLLVKRNHLENYNVRIFNHLIDGYNHILIKCLPEDLFY